MGFAGTLNSFFETFNDYVGGYLLLLFLIPIGVFYAVRLRFFNIRFIGHTLKVIAGKYDDENEHGEINHFKALTTALSGTVGTGNIVGVALALYYGGPGAIFWMWITGFLGMMLKFAECTLSIKYRREHPDGHMSGGPMYYIEEGLKKAFKNGSKILAVVFAGATILCSIGTGNTAQSNSIAGVLFENYNLAPWVSGIIMSILVLLVTIGGIKRISKVTSVLVPFMAILYFLSAIIVLVIFYRHVPDAILMIIKDAFMGTAATGGFLGSGFIIALRYGVARGIFSNESGQGTAGIAYSAVKTNYPAREGLVSSIGPFIDTIVICSLTALVIIVSGSWKSGIEGVGMTLEAYQTGFSFLGLPGFSQHIISISLSLFAFSTILTYSYYGTQGTEYLFGEKSVIYFQIIYGIFVFIGAITHIQLVWNFVDMSIVFMALPNLLALMFLSKVVLGEVNSYRRLFLRNK
jgi:AGCS family alanine or glycine:cation symporter